jgi:hypothetical protein
MDTSEAGVAGLAAGDPRICESNSGLQIDRGDSHAKHVGELTAVCLSVRASRSHLARGNQRLVHDGYTPRLGAKMMV